MAVLLLVAFEDELRVLSLTQAQQQAISAYTRALQHVTPLHLPHKKQPPSLGPP